MKMVALTLVYLGLAGLIVAAMRHEQAGSFWCLVAALCTLLVAAIIHWAVPRMDLVWKWLKVAAKAFDHLA